MNKAIVVKAGPDSTEQTDWGALTWYASGDLGNSQRMTTGLCVIKPGCENPKHQHPNCEEILTVFKGTIAHAIEDGKEVELSEGDTITLPIGLSHNARNIGDEDAVLIITFSSAQRRAKGE